MLTEAELVELSRSEIQALAKRHGVKANSATKVIISELIAAQSDQVNVDVDEVAAEEVAAEEVIEAKETAIEVEEEQLQAEETVADEVAAEEVAAEEVIEAKETAIEVEEEQLQAEETFVVKGEEVQVEAEVEEKEDPKTTVVRKGKRKSLLKKKKSPNMDDATLPEAPPAVTETAATEAMMPPAPPAQDKPETKAPPVLLAPKPRLNKAAMAMMEARQKAAREMNQKEKDMEKKDSMQMIFTNNKPSKVAASATRQPLHFVKTYAQGTVAAAPKPMNVFKAKPMPAFYKKGPAKETKAVDENTKPKVDTNAHPMKRDFSRLLKPTAASKSGMMEKVVKEKSCTKSPFNPSTAVATSGAH